MLTYACIQVKQEVEAFYDKFGVDPQITDAMPGFNSFNTSRPPPLHPPPTAKRGDLVIPDVFSSVPEAVRASSDGHRLFVRAGNHTWLGVARGTPRHSASSPFGGTSGPLKTPDSLPLNADSPYDYWAATRPVANAESADYLLALHGAVLVPPLDAAPVANWVLAEYLDPEIESFCLHVTGERGARLCGRWLLKGNSVGSFSGVESVYLGNETALLEADGAQDELAYRPTIQVRGGPWLFDRCGLRACMAVAMLCARRSLVKIRNSVAGGISHDGAELSGGGRACMALDCR